MAKLKELTERLNALSNQIVQQNAQRSEQAQADHAALQNEADAAAAEEGVHGRQATAPKNVKDTLETETETEVSGLRQQVEAMAGIIEQLASRGADTSKLTAQIAQMERQVKRLEERRMEWDGGGNPKRAYTADEHERLMRSVSGDERVIALQREHDKLVPVQAILNARKVHSNIPWLPRTRSIQDVPSYKDWDMAYRALYTTGTNAGADLIGTSFSGQVHLYYEMLRKVSSLIPTVNAPPGSGSYIYPMTTTAPSVYIVGERSNDDGSNIDASTIATDKATFTPKVLGARTRFSNQLNEDSLYSVGELNQNAFVNALKGAEENAVINGDTTATHLDTGETVAANDERRMCDGLRDAAAAASSSVDLSTYADSTFLKGIGSMGDYSDDPEALVLVASTTAYWGLLVGNDKFKTFSETGQPMQGSAFSGRLPNDRFFGLNVANSGKVRRDLNASGIFDNSTKTKTMMMAFDPRQWLMVRWRDITVEVDKDIESQQYIMVTTMRWMLKKMAAATAVSEVLFYNI